MSPRRHRRRDGPGPDRAGPAGGLERVEESAGETWVVRFVSGAGAVKSYRCPGCDHEIRPATPHLVAWPTGDPEGRRHWHVACWRARERRGPRPLRPGRGPRH